MSQSPVAAAHAALQTFADALYARATGPARGEPEAQLSAPVNALLEALTGILGAPLTLQAEVRAQERLGIPDFAASREGLLLGFIELKAPGLGADTSRFTGRNRQQWERFKALPNLIYTDGNEWALYQQGELVRPVVRLAGDITRDGARAVSEDDAKALLELLSTFIAWEVIPPKNAQALAETLAPLCRALRDQVTEALGVATSPLNSLARDWRELLFPKATNDQFADSYAQTVTYAMLLARAEGADVNDIDAAVDKLEHGSTMLARALEVMTDRTVLNEIRPAVRLIQRVIANMDPDALGGERDPWLYFYEDFLAAYDPDLRRDAGAYYTPTQVVHAQVRLVDDLLVNRLNRPLGFAEGGDVVVLDPAVGTGTYLLGVIEHAMQRVIDEEGPGAARSSATLLGAHIHGFELMTGSYAVAQLRVAQAITSHGGRVPAEGAPIYLTNTLDSPYAEPPAMPLFMEPIAQENRRALKVKERETVLVCIGNPPYDRHEAATAENRAMTGGWVRYGDDRRGTPPILGDFLEPARAAGYGGQLKNAYNLYVYFWRWALWKVFEHDTNHGSGIVSFITGSSYLDGDAFVGMREHMRRQCDDVWIIDIGGEGRGARRSENVFAIQTPVAIAIAFREGRRSQRDTPARVHYTRIDGSRAEKLAVLESVRSVADLPWTTCPDGWQAPFKPTGVGDYYRWPLLADLMPWQQSGVKVGRTWPFAETEKLLESRWMTLVSAQSEKKSELFVDRPTGRKNYQAVNTRLVANQSNVSIANSVVGEQSPDIVRYGFRALDRHYIFADVRLIDRPSPPLWQAISDKQVFITSMLTNSPLSFGPALVASPYIPDLHYFSGRGAKDILPLYRDAQATEPNIAPGLLEQLWGDHAYEVTPEVFAAYLYGIMAHPAYTARYEAELEEKAPRVPITKDHELFDAVVRVGTQLLFLQTYGERYVPDGVQRGQIPRGRARIEVAVPDEPERYPEAYRYDAATQTLFVGDGQVVPVMPEVYGFEVSGLKVVQSWLGYRMRVRSGRKSSPLDDIRPHSWTAEMSRELLRLLWILEATLALYPEQEVLLDLVAAGPLWTATDLPEVPERARQPPAQPPRGSGAVQTLDF